MQEIYVSLIDCYKKDVADGGGIWVGTMECPASRDDMPGYTLILFNSPQTGSTLALKDWDITSQLVREHIAESNAKFSTPEKK